MLFRSDHACSDHGNQVHVHTNAPSEPRSVDSGVSALAKSWRQDQRKKAKQHAARIRASNQRRQVPGVTCPSNEAIQSAIRDQNVSICMTPDEVMEAAPADREEPYVKHRLLPTGPSVVEWVYSPVVTGWPAVIRFNDNHVIGFTNDLPEYYYYNLK